MTAATIAVVSDDVLRPFVAGTLVDVVEVEVVEVGALVAGVVVAGTVVTGVVGGNVVAGGNVVGGVVAVVGASVDGGAVVDVVCAPAPAVPNSARRPSRAMTMTMTMTTLEALRVIATRIGASAPSQLP